VAQGRAGPRVERAVRRRRRRHLLRRQALQPDQGPASPTAARCSPSSSRPARRRRSSTSASRTSAPSAWSAWSRRCAPRSRSAGRRDPLRAARGPTADRAAAGGAGARRDAGVSGEQIAPTTWCWRSATARATPSRCCTSAACTWKPSPSRSASASSTRKPDRPGALRPQRRPPADPGRGRLQAGAPRQQRPLGLQLLHVPGRHRGGGHLRARPRGHQRHEPVLAQRAQRQRRHRGRHQPGLPDYPGGPLAGIAFQRNWESRLRAGRRRLRAPAQLVGDFLKGRLHRSARRALVQARRAPGRPGQPRQPARLRHRRHPRGPAGLRPADQGLRHADAVLTGVETRTSSPLRITARRDYQSLNVRGLYPAGEGAGYAGGILSAGVDGIEVAEAVRAPGSKRQPRSSCSCAGCICRWPRRASTGHHAAVGVLAHAERVRHSTHSTASTYTARYHAMHAAARRPSSSAYRPVTISRWMWCA
jgi:hypothetical protein